MASATTIVSLPRITATALSSIILAQPPTPNPTIAIIDVRDEDHIGGHIVNSTHIPSQTLDHKIPELVHKLQDKDTVVFHCALSQQRGPSAALRYLRERERLLGAAPKSQRNEDKEVGVIEQKVYVLDRGFVGWQEIFGEDERLTEGYKKEIWKDGYWM